MNRLFAVLTLAITTSLLAACLQDDNGKPIAAIEPSKIQTLNSSKTPIELAQNEWKRDTALYFYKSLSLYNYDSAARYVKDPEPILAMKDNGATLTVKQNSFKFNRIVDEGVILTFSRYCYPDREHLVYLEQVGRGFKIDFERTQRQLMESAMANVDHYKPLKKYCYDFKDQPLQGELGGSEWLATGVGLQEVQYPGGRQTSITIHEERCKQYPECIYVANPSSAGTFVLVSQLDFSGTGGNFSSSENITISYNSSNKIISEGSYRVNKLPNGKTRLEISFPDDESYSLNGFIDFTL